MADRTPTPRLRAACAVAASILCLPGCASLLSSIDWTGKAEEPDVENLRGELKFGDEEKVVGSYVVFGGLSPVIIEGVGLVTGLDNTGGDVPPSAYRTNIKEDMKRRRVPAPDKLLASPTTAVVLVRAFIPALHQKGDPLDVQVTLPPESEATSLRGGWLLQCSLYERRVMNTGTSLRGRELARCEGPVLISPTADRDIRDAATVRTGTVPAGGKYIGDSLTMTVNLRSDYRSVRMAERIAKHVGHRFHGFDEYGIKRSLAEAKTDSRIVLEVPEEYEDNHVRFLRVVRRVHLKETPIERRLRIEALRSELADPTTAEEAAFELEAIGREAMPVLREALGNESLYCRFQAAVALCYLDDPIGVPHLVEAAREDEALRVWAFLAMASLDGGEAIEGLSSLLNEDAVETRYGAVRAITTVDPNHPAVRGRKLTDRCVLREIAGDKPPVIHITKAQKSEITLFNSGQRFTLPLAARAGHRILVTGKPGDAAVTISRFEPGKPDQKKKVSPRVSDVLRACAEMGATYPDLVSLILEADAQHNLPGPVEIDTLPSAGRIYDGSQELDGEDEEPEPADDFRGWDGELPEEAAAEEEPEEEVEVTPPAAADEPDADLPPPQGEPLVR